MRLGGNLRSLLLAFAAIASVAAGSARGSDAWIVPQDKFDCILNNIKAYSDQPRDPVFIFVGECPLTDMAAIIASRTVNTLPTISRREDASLPWDEVIVIRKSELACLEDTAKPHGEGLLAIPKLPCG